MSEPRWRVPLPRGAEPPYRVFLNAVEQREGEDFEIEGHALVFDRPLEKERIGFGRWTAMFLGLFGSYGKNDAIDVQYHLHGKPFVATNLDFVAPEDEHGQP